MLEQIGIDLQDAVQELRNLAHGIYPPLLMDRGLGEALSAAAGRAALPDRCRRRRASAATRRRWRRRSTSAASRRSRTRPSTPVTAPQAMITVREDEHALLFEVPTTAPGSTSRPARTTGHGFVNMSDRVGAIGGSITVESAPGRGHRHPRPHPSERLND